MATACITPVCTDSCADALPEVEFNICAPGINFGEIDAIFITNVGNPMLDETDPLEWATRMALLVTDPTRIIELNVIGDKPAPESTEVAISRNRIVVGAKGHSVNIEIQETNQKNYDMLRAFECGKKIKFWYRTAGGLLYGGNVGIDGSMVLNEIIPKSRKELIVFAGAIKWEAKHHPCRTLSVI
jgi:hypothetical protein